MAHRGRKNRDQALAIALASGLSIEEAAARASVSTRTAHRRLEDRQFCGLVQGARCRMFDDAVGKVAAAMSEAIDTLKALATSGTPAVRLGAARSILDLGPRMREHAELVARVEAIESRERQRRDESCSPV